MADNEKYYYIKLKDKKLMQHIRLLVNILETMVKVINSTPEPDGTIKSTGYAYLQTHRPLMQVSRGASG